MKMTNLKIINPFFVGLCLLLLIKAVVMTWVILHAEIGLGPDEAQYWTWGRYLDWGYYSKPPAIAWQIRLGCEIFGNNELGVRAFSIVISTALALSVYFLALACDLKARLAFWAGTVLAFSPLGIMAALFAITDGGMVLFWTLACVLLARALQTNSPPNYYLLGALILCGALFKWPIYLFWIFVLLGGWLSTKILNGHLVGGIVLSLLGLLPSVMWNSQHDWVTFRHVFSTIQGGTAVKKSLIAGNFFEFLGAQAALLSPLIFILLLCAFVFLLKKRQFIPNSLFFCGISSLIIITIFSVAAFFQKIQGNWGIFAYPSGIVFLTWYALEKTVYGEKWLKLGLALALILCGLALSIPYLQAHALLSPYAIPYKFNPFRHNVGWDQLNLELQSAGYDPEQHFLFGDKYQTSSILSFYGPEQKRAYFLNLQGIRKNQFSFWPNMAMEQQGKSGFFIVTENSPHLERDLDQQIKSYQAKLAPYFQSVHYLGLKPIFENNGKVVKAALLFKCSIYNGNQPVEPQLY